MAEIVLDVESAPATPAAGQIILFPETTGKRWSFKDDAGRTYTMGQGCIRNQAVASVGPGFTADTYIVGSAITVPPSLTLQVGTQYRCLISLNRTAGGGIGTPVLTLRIGTAGSTADAAICTFTGAASTSAVDAGLIEVLFTVRTVGAAATSQGTFSLKHNLASGAGLSGTDVIEAAGTAFNSTTASLILGVSLNYGATATTTTTQVEAELLNI